MLLMHMPENDILFIILLIRLAYTHVLALRLHFVYPPRPALEESAAFATLRRFYKGPGFLVSSCNLLHET